MVASHNFLEYAEFLFYLQEYGYSDFLTSTRRRPLGHRRYLRGQHAHDPKGVGPLAVLDRTNSDADPRRRLPENLEIHRGEYPKALDRSLR